MSDALAGPAGSISRQQAAWMLGLLVATLVLLSLLGENTRLALRYERDAVLQGEYWRLLTGHLVHGSWLHLSMNGAGVALIAALFPRDYSLRQWLFIALVSTVAIDLGFVFLQPQLLWYVGLSGVLHGALAAGGVAWWRYESKPMAALLSAIFIGKLAWEQWHGALPLSGDLPVVVDAHLYGACGGVTAAAILWLRERSRTSDRTHG